MTLTPEISMYIRDTFKYVGALLVGLGIISTKNALAAESLSELAIPLIQTLVGLGLAVYATVKARNAKKPESVEAQVIADRVNDKK